MNTQASEHYSWPGILACSLSLSLSLSRSLSLSQGFESSQLQVMVFWDVLPCSLVGRHLCFGDTCYLHLQDKRIIRCPCIFTRNQIRPSSSRLQSLSPTVYRYLLSLFPTFRRLWEPHNHLRTLANSYGHFVPVWMSSVIY
jgi:hypothetical protein